MGLKLTKQKQTKTKSEELKNVIGASVILADMVKFRTVTVSKRKYDTAKKIWHTEFEIGEVRLYNPEFIREVSAKTLKTEQGLFEAFHDWQKISVRDDKRYEMLYPYNPDELSKEYRAYVYKDVVKVTGTMNVVTVYFPSTGGNNGTYETGFFEV